MIVERPSRIWTVERESQDKDVRHTGENGEGALTLLTIFLRDHRPPVANGAAHASGRSSAARRAESCRCIMCDSGGSISKALLFLQRMARVASSSGST